MTDLRHQHDFKYNVVIFRDGTYGIRHTDESGNFSYLLHNEVAVKWLNDKDKCKYDKLGDVLHKFAKITHTCNAGKEDHGTPLSFESMGD